MPTAHPPHYAAGLRLQTWVDQYAWKDAVNVGVGVDGENQPCLHLYVQTKDHPLALRPGKDVLPAVWEGLTVLHHQVGPMVAQAR